MLPARNRHGIGTAATSGLKLCRALGYDLNTVEFAVDRGIPYAIDFMNPVPDADVYSVGAANFDWIGREVANMAIAKAKTAPHLPRLHWSALLSASARKAKKASAPRTRPPAARSKTRATST